MNGFRWFFWTCGQWPRTNRLDFGGDSDAGFLNLDQNRDTEIFHYPARLISLFVEVKRQRVNLFRRWLASTFVAFMLKTANRLPCSNSNWTNTADGADVLYNRFNVTSSIPPENPPSDPNSEYRCVTATTGNPYWRLSRCSERQRVVCQPGLWLLSVQCDV